MTKLLTQNKKIKGSSNDRYTVFNFGIPAYRSKTGKVTCPMAGQCGKDGGCYALQGAYTWSTVATAYEYRLAETLKDTFQETLGKELETKIKTATRQNKTVVVRIHDSGDFYDLEYLYKWIDIAIRYPSVKFYAYTKMVTFKKVKTPDNFTLILSYGGMADTKINPKLDRHSQVFGSLTELHKAGYVDATENDLEAAFSENHKIGLVYHGAKAKEWTTN